MLRGTRSFPTNSVSTRYFKISLAYLTSNIKGLLKLEGETRYMDCSVLIRNSEEATEVETNSWYDFIYCRFCGEGDREQREET